jgi:hypothetical protein
MKSPEIHNSKRWWLRIQALEALGSIPAPKYNQTKNQ